MNKPGNEEPTADPAAPSGAAAGPPISEKPKEGRLAGFDALKFPAYRWYALCAALQQAAESMKMLANGWYAFELTGSTAILSLTIFAQAVPQTLLSFFGGVVSDRFPRHRVWQVCNVLALALPLAMSAAILTHTITWHWLVAQSFLFGIVLAFRAPARQGIMTETVPREKIMSAVSINQTVTNILGFIGPAMAGFIIGWVGVQWAYMTMTVFYVLAILSLMPMKYERRNNSLRRGAARGNIIDNIKDGLKYVRRTPDVRAVLTLTLVAGAFGMPYQQLLPAFGKTILHTTPQMLGVISSITGGGALLGSMSVAFLRPKMRGSLFIRATFIAGIVLVAFTLNRSYVLCLGIVFILGIFQAVRMNMASTLIQTYTEDAYLGRVLSVNFAQNGLSSTLAFAVGIMAQKIGVQNAVMITSMGMICAGGLWWIFSRRLRRLA